MPPPTELRARYDDILNIRLRDVIICVAFALATHLPILAAAAEAPATQTPIPELNTLLMQSTYLIYGPAKSDSTKTAFGTAFLMGKLTPDKAKAYYVLITAAHVVEAIDGEFGTLQLREKQSDSSYAPRPWKIRLREEAKPLYVKHKDADVVALYVNMPDKLDVVILPTDMLADDATLSKFEIHPGDELFCLGFPLFVSSDSGFPILRSGIIASYPLIPTNINKQFYFDFPIFEGNSGGPVYFIGHDRTYGGITHLGEIEQFVVGLATAQRAAPAYNNSLIQLAVVVPSPYIRETIDLLPAESPYK